MTINDDNIQLSTKRKTKSQASTSSKKKKKTISASGTNTVKRTKSFEPAWWGNVMTVKGGASLHAHATTASATAASSTIAHTNNSPTINASFPPVHTLILGTHPSTTSLERNEMFAHPQNAFWYIAGDALGFRRSLAVSTATGKPYASYHSHLRYDENKIIEYPQQLELLVSKGFAMWDIVAECKREGSLDNDIQDEIPNRIREFCEGTLYNTDGNIIDTAEHLYIKRIVIANGTTGGQLFVKHFSDWFMDGKLRAANDEMSQRVLKAVMNKSKRSNNGICEHSIEVVCLPSVSPAAASFTYLEKRDAWEKGCYDPGLADYHRWNQSKGRSEKLRQSTPDMIKSHATPTKQTKSKSPKALTTPSPSKAPTARLFSSDLAKLTPENDWIDLEAPPQELRPSATLTNGQCFNWLVVENDSDTAATTPSPQKSAWGVHNANEWVGPLQNRVLSIRETPTTTMCRVLCGPTQNVKEDLQRYFRLEIPLAPLYDEWSRQDARLSKIATAIPGVRILRQDPIECMFSFICSSNNNIPRITKMLSSFREKYGKFMMELPVRNDVGDIATTSLFQFPTLDTLANASEEELRAMGLGYRAKYLIETRDLLAECGGDDYLRKLRTTPESQTVQDELIKFSGIGRKVADCIALFSLDQDDAIPVDVHVQHIACRDYDSTVLGGAKSITPTIYKRVGDLFRDRFSNYPGWAHSLLFVAELPSFRDVLPIEVVREMDEWRGLEQMKKLEKKDGNKTQSN
jgi:N-glycosylase/DNA lyase